MTEMLRCDYVVSEAISRIARPITLPATIRETGTVVFHDGMGDGVPLSGRKPKEKQA